ncbi:MAG: extracellular solute-binding protein [Ornithinimicrobium sp.]
MKDLVDPVLSRRGLVSGLGIGAVAGLSGCGGFRLQSDGSDRPDDVLQFTLWAGDVEEQAFRALAAGFEKENDVTVRLQIVPFSQALTTVDTGLRVDNPPDVFRVTYNDVGLYRDQGVLASLDDSVVDALRPAVGEQFWAAVTDDRGTFAVPHHTDTSMLLVNTEALASAGIDTIPDSPDQAWTWEEFATVAEAVRNNASGGRYAAAVNWQQAGAFRWLNWVDQGGGRLLTSGLGDSVQDPDQLVAAMSFTRRLFTEGLVPRSSLPKSSQYTDQLFVAETVAMAWVGNFSLPGMDIPFDWQATFLPQQARASADLGGNSLAAVDGPRKEAAQAFIAYCLQKQQQADYCAATGVLPTRNDIDTASLDYPVDPAIMARYARQSQDVRTDLVRQVTIPKFNAVNSVLVDELELSFLSPDDSDEARAASLLDAVSAEMTR